MLLFPLDFYLSSCVQSKVMELELDKHSQTRSSFKAQSIIKVSNHDICDVQCNFSINLSFRSCVCVAPQAASQ